MANKGSVKVEVMGSKDSAKEVMDSKDLAKAAMDSKAEGMDSTVSVKADMGSKDLAKAVMGSKAEGTDLHMINRVVGMIAIMDMAMDIKNMDIRYARNTG
ncbi:uncharacterized protein LOC129726160 isoform X3 [Wyeomyia smithii]|nr:uncharacterized protein LOC129726160 isoform X3 [Wyeomyia smithii]